MQILIDAHNFVKPPDSADPEARARKDAAPSEV